MSEHLIPNDMILWHLQTLRDQPEVLQSVLQNASTTQSALASSEEVLTADQFAQLLKQTIVLLNDETFGLLEQPLYRGTFHLMCQACISCNNLQQVIELCIRFYRVLNPQFNWQLVIEQDTCFLEFNFNRLDKQESGYLLAYITVVIWRWLSWMINKPIVLSEVNFAFNAPVSEQSLAAIFKRSVKQQQDKNKIGFDSSYLTAPVKQTAQTLGDFLVTVPECLLSHYRQDMTVSGQLYEYVKQHERVSQLSLSEAATHFYCSEQSLIRRLKAEGTKFKQVVDAVQKKRARELVLTSALSNQQIALKLGYTDTSVFYRKFKSWFEQTPNQYRQSIK